MEELNLNIPAFYPGEEIICIDDSGTSGTSKGKEYIADRCSVKCKCGPVVFLRGLPARGASGVLINKGQLIYCPKCLTVSESKGDYQAYLISRFVSKKQLTSPPMSFSKMEEKEKTVKKPQILIPN